MAFAQTVGIDGHHLLEMIYSDATPSFLSVVPAVEIMRTIFVQQYYIEADQVYWREKGNLPPAALAISSPHDAEARYTNKRDTTWVGYKVHLTETCDEDSPHLITSVIRRTIWLCNRLGRINIPKHSNNVTIKELASRGQSLVRPMLLGCEQRAIVG